MKVSWVVTAPAHVKIINCSNSRGRSKVVAGVKVNTGHISALQNTTMQCPPLEE